MAEVAVAIHRERGTNERRRPTIRWNEPVDEWRHKVQQWVDAGIVTPSQAQEILKIEDRDVSRSGTPTSRADSARGVSPLAELAWYLAILLVAACATFFVGHFWSQLGVAGHLSIGLVIGVVGLCAGVVVRQMGDDGAQRLGSFLWLFGTGGVAIAMSAAIDRAGRHDRGLSLLAVGLAVLLLSGALWRNRERPLQFLSAIVGLTLTLSGAGVVGHLQATSSEISLVVWFTAMAIGLMSLQMLRPALTGLVVAEFGTLVGAFALSFPNHVAGVALGLISAIAAVVVGLTLERPGIIVVGAIGFFMFDIRVFTLYLRSEDVALGAFVTGLAVVSVALWRAVHITSVASQSDAALS
ncbi:MAG: DUF2157 domain-containing protein, partial [Acidimicrobiales bacterium]